MGFAVKPSFIIWFRIFFLLRYYFYDLLSMIKIIERIFFKFLSFLYIGE